jgi:hypothetical protein
VKYVAVDVGHIVCKQGAQASDLYIVMSGILDVSVEVPREQVGSSTTDGKVRHLCACKRLVPIRAPL